MGVSESDYRTLFEQNPDALVLVDPEPGRIRDCNQRFCDLVERDRDDVREREITDVMTARPGTSASIDDQLDAAGTSRETFEWRIQRERGSPVAVDVRLSAAVIDDTTYTLVRVAPPTTAGTSIQGQELGSPAIENAPIGITISDPSRDDNPLVYANDGFQELTGYSNDEIVGRNCRFLQGENTDPDAVQKLREGIDAEEPVSVELRNYRKDGTEFWNRVTVVPAYDDGTLTHFVGVQQDVTDRKQYEQELELAQRLLETVPSGVARTEPSSDGTFEYVNPALVSLLDAESAAHLRDHRAADVYVNPDQRDALIDALRTTDTERVRHEVEFETFDGETKNVAVTATLSEDETGTEHLHKVVQDITDRKEREEKLERYERLVENLPIGVFQSTSDPRGEFRLLNDAMVDIFDADSIEHLRTHTIRELYANPDERDAINQTLREHGRITEQELKLVTLDGEEFWGSVTAIAREKDGETVFDGVVQDITARKQYEERLAEQRDNLEMLNQMLRHDIRNDLQVVTAYADVLSDHVDDDGVEYLETIEESATHAVELTETARDLADVMRSTDDNTKPIDLRATLRAEVDDVRSAYPDAAITVEGAIPQCSVVANAMLDSVFQNLLRNAVQHNDKAVPEVQVTASESEETAVVRIADNGPGIRDAQKETIFGKGETGGESSGTGIGLYLVDRLVDAYGGTVHIEDNDPTGTVVRVELPKAN